MRPIMSIVPMEAATRLTNAVELEPLTHTGAGGVEIGLAIPGGSRA